MRYWKKVLRKMRMMHEMRPRDQERKVMTGRDGSSVSGTTRATSSIGVVSSGGFWEALESLLPFSEAIGEVLGSLQLRLCLFFGYYQLLLSLSFPRWI